jgi:anti-sigma regulatory factor (Ser/Thr protein kinase)
MATVAQSESGSVKSRRMDVSGHVAMGERANMNGCSQKTTPETSARQGGAGGGSPRRLELKITSDTANLRPTRKEIENFAAAGGMKVESCEALGLVLNEALANIMRHGYGGAVDQPIEVSAEFSGAELKVTIRDWAKPFDPSEHLHEPDLNDIKPGGLGLLCMRKLMDDVKWERLADGMRLTMMKKV